ncbi:uncharacterized protein FIBRA_09212 [Fibroporia radiculosa]|uniref:Uncharacterized protein n=1 Tax=Fibroporia radiculosa TaxID=599839 RepID=J7RH56_9APHY|nr:uncharacterized protein FIBRA_09212 [Fibroporia radiculosa]CCM06902.1 predicted protein [Fibroporia radiculosa]
MQLRRGERDHGRANWHSAGITVPASTGAACVGVPHTPEKLQQSTDQQSIAQTFVWTHISALPAIMTGVASDGYITAIDARVHEHEGYHNVRGRQPQQTTGRAAHVDRGQTCRPIRTLGRPRGRRTTTHQAELERPDSPGPELDRPGRLASVCDVHFDPVPPALALQCV